MYLLQEEQHISVDEQVSTRSRHRMMVEQVIHNMHSYLAESLTLEDMADMACLSPYYFNRVFHQCVGIPPGEFLATLRLNAAKRLLLTTNLSITDICFSVGYNGLGSFTTRFTQLVGVAPRRLRHLASNEPVKQKAVRGRVTELAGLQMSSPWNVTGVIQAEQPVRGNIFIGLFPKPIPQGRPVSCALLEVPGPFHLAPVPTGKYYLMVAALPRSTDPMSYLLPTSSMLVGIAGPLLVLHGQPFEPVNVFLRRTRLSDPPIICALPYL